MMMDVLLEEDEGTISPLPGSTDATDQLVTEQARKLFCLCDENGKGFVVKADLKRIEGFIPGMSPSKMESLFDAIDSSKTNFVTESQFVEGIKPILLNPENDANNRSKSSTAIISGSAHNGRDAWISGSESSDSGHQDPPMRKSNAPVQEANYKAAEPDVDACSGVFDKRNSVSNVQDYLPIRSISDAGKCVPVVNDDTEGTAIDPISAFIGSLKDELTTAEIGQKEEKLLSSERNKQAEAQYPFSVENKIIEPPCAEPEMMERRQHLKLDQLDDLHKRETSSQIDLRRSLYHPDVKHSPGSRSLADVIASYNIVPREISSLIVRYILYLLCFQPRPDYLPERIFKVVFVGDSAVGKTCFLHRFCHNRFKPLFNATIGVDFTVKTIRLQNRVVAVQLWDTAGQERFRSITKQYFRKADGVILMYDVTSEQSFLNVRNWIDSVKAGVDENCVMCLVGNKAVYLSSLPSLFTFPSLYLILHGQKLAEEFGMLFFETSAFTGYNVNDCMKAVAMRLQQREDEDLEEALKLDMGVQGKQRSWCCP
uniref:EF-hand domain-containing protein n=1 Tax=Ascaris lumbricoides TaxID=6252 RepID=A0A9J2P8M6_ASCLU